MNTQNDWKEKRVKCSHIDKYQKSWKTNHQKEIARKFLIKRISSGENKEEKEEEEKTPY